MVSNYIISTVDSGMKGLITACESSRKFDVLK